MQGLALALGKPIVPVSTFEALAAAARGTDAGTLVAPLGRRASRRGLRRALRRGRRGRPIADVASPPPPLDAWAPALATLRRVRRAIQFVGDGAVTIRATSSQPRSARRPTIADDGAARCAGAIGLHRGRAAPQRAVRAARPRRRSTSGGPTRSWRASGAPRDAPRPLHDASSAAAAMTIERLTRDDLDAIVALEPSRSPTPGRARCSSGSSSQLRRDARLRARACRIVPVAAFCVVLGDLRRAPHQHPCRRPGARGGRDWAARCCCTCVMAVARRRGRGGRRSKSGRSNLAALRALRASSASRSPASGRNYSHPARGGCADSVARDAVDTVAGRPLAS